MPKQSTLFFASFAGSAAMGREVRSCLTQCYCSRPETLTTIVVPKLNHNPITSLNLGENGLKSSLTRECSG